MRALARVDLTTRVHDALPPLPPTRANVRVIAIGKAAAAMAKGALSRWQSRIEHALVVAPEGTDAGGLESAEVLRASHPLPDGRSVAAAERTALLAEGGARDVRLVLISGGASSLVCSPAPGLSFDRKRECISALLASGAPIGEVNTARRHLSSIKGGGLTRRAFPARVLALLASDVVVGEPYDIGSGPTMVDPTTVADARRVLAQFAPQFGDIPLIETLKANDAAPRRQRARVIASPNELATLVSDELRAQGFVVHVRPPSVAEVSELSREYAEALAVLGPREAIVRAAEPSLVVPPRSSGRGGRSGHLAALVALKLPRGTAFLAGASDGVDAASGAAGASVDAAFAELLGSVRIAGALSAFDTAALHEEAGTAIAGRPTGLNLADVHVLARA
jgi:glycerate 2-kinase